MTTSRDNRIAVTNADIVDFIIYQYHTMKNYIYWQGHRVWSGGNPSDPEAYIINLKDKDPENFEPSEENFTRFRNILREAQRITSQINAFDQGHKLLPIYEDIVACYKILEVLDRKDQEQRRKAEEERERRREERRKAKEEKQE